MKELLTTRHIATTEEAKLTTEEAKLTTPGTDEGPNQPVREGRRLTCLLP